MSDSPPSTIDIRAKRSDAIFMDRIFPHGFFPAAARAFSVGSAILLVLAFALSTARAGFVETFDNGGDEGDWHLTVSPPTLEPDGGNTGAYLRASGDGAVP